MARDAGRNALFRYAGRRDYGAALHQLGIQYRQRKQRSLDRGVIGGDILFVLIGKRLRDRRHHRARPRVAGEILQLLIGIKGELAGQPRETATAVADASVAVAIAAGWDRIGLSRTGRLALVRDDRPAAEIALIGIP